MAHRPKGYGMSAEIANRQAAKYNAELAAEVFQWIGQVLAEGGHAQEAAALPEDLSDPKNVQNSLRDGVILCKLINVIRPGSVTKVNNSKAAFKMMENVGCFLSACEGLGMKKIDLFQTVDLYDGNNIPQVLNGIIAFGRKAHALGYDGPVLGPAEASANPREFTEEQLRAGEGVIGLQAGSNKGATQAGQNFGKTRMIID